DLDVAHYHELIANAADYMVDRFAAEVVFVPMEPRSRDVQHAHAVVGEMRHAHHATVLKGNYSPGQILSLLGHFELAVGMRLHLLSLAALAVLPFMALPYAAKVTGFLHSLGMQAPPIGEISSGQLIANLDRSWHARDQLRARLREVV